MTQTIAMMLAHDEADGGRSYGGGMTADSRGLTNGGKAGGGGAQGEDGEPKSKGDWEDPWDQVGPDGAGGRGGDGDPDGRGGAGATED